jgi:hypothetical protein
MMTTSPGWTVGTSICSTEDVRAGCIHLLSELMQPLRCAHGNHIMHSELISSEPIA